MTTRHPSDAMLSEHLAGALDAQRRSRVERHLAACDLCRARLEAVAVLDAELAALPRDVQPARDLWRDIRAEIESAVAPPAGVVEPEPELAAPEPEVEVMDPGPVALEPEPEVAEPAIAEAELEIVASPTAIEEPPVVALEIEPAPPEPDVIELQRPRRLRRPPAWLAAAAVLLVVGAAAMVSLVGGDGSAVDPDALPPAAEQFARLEAPYREASAELAATIAQRRDDLPGELDAPLASALAIIDEAVRETRAAVAADPDNEALAEMALAAQRRKLELLQRVTQWSSDE